MPKAYDPAALKFLPLSEECPRGAFSCGNETVDRWFAEKAHRHQNGSRCRVTTVHNGEDPAPVAFYALNIVAERFTDRPPLIDYFFSPADKDFFPSLRLEWLAVHSDYQRNKLGTLVMGKVLDLFRLAALEWNAPTLTLKPINERAEAFYTELGFVRFGAAVLGKRMLLPAETVLEMKRLLAKEQQQA